MNYSQKIAHFVSDLNYGDLPEKIKSNVDLRIMDLIASCAAGKRINGAMNDIVLAVLEQQGGTRQSSLIFQKQAMPAAQAAFYNAFVANGADMDDGHMLANGHPGVTTIPPVLAVAESRNSSYEEIATAIVAGYETYIRISNAIMPSHLQRGFNGTGTVGSIAAAVAVSKLIKLDENKTHNAMGLAATSASGLMELNESGQAMKPINPANAAYRGVFCALLAEAGAVGPVATLDGSNGFLRAFADSASIEDSLLGMGEEFLMDTGYIKLYPACRHMHAMIDCAAALYNEGGFSLDDITHASLYTYPTSQKLTGLILYPKSEDEAKFSLTYSTATALKTGNFTLDDLNVGEELDADISSLISRMEIIVEPGLEDRARMIRGSRLEIRLINGEKRSSAVDVPKGEKDFPLDWPDLRKKFAVCSEGLLSKQSQDLLFNAAKDFKNVSDLRSFFALTASDTARLV